MAEPGRELSGVGGWLQFFVVVLAVFTPLVAVTSTIANLYGDPDVAAAYGEVWPTLEAVEWGLVAVAILGSWFLAWRLVYVQVWKTVRMVIAGIWLLGLGFLFLELLAVSIVAGLPIGVLMDGIGPDLVRPFIFGAIWTAYFLKSERVANTYPRYADGEEMAEVFS